MTAISGTLCREQMLVIIELNWGVTDIVYKNSSPFCDGTLGLVFLAVWSIGRRTDCWRLRSTGEAHYFHCVCTA